MACPLTKTPSREVCGCADCREAEAIDDTIDSILGAGLYAPEPRGFVIYHDDDTLTKSDGELDIQDERRNARKARRSGRKGSRMRCGNLSLFLYWTGNGYDVTIKRSGAVIYTCNVGLPPSIQPAEASDPKVRRSAAHAALSFALDDKIDLDGADSTETGWLIR